MIYMEWSCGLDADITLTTEITAWTIKRIEEPSKKGHTIFRKSLMHKDIDRIPIEDVNLNASS